MGNLKRRKIDIRDYGYNDIPDVAAYANTFTDLPSPQTFDFLSHYDEGLLRDFVTKETGLEEIQEDGGLSPTYIPRHVHEDRSSYKGLKNYERSRRRYESLPKEYNWGDLRDFKEKPNFLIDDNNYPALEYRAFPGFSGVNDNDSDVGSVRDPLFQPEDTGSDEISFLSEADHGSSNGNLQDALINRGTLRSALLGKIGNNLPVDLQNETYKFMDTERKQIPTERNLRAWDGFLEKSERLIKNSGPLSMFELEEEKNLEDEFGSDFPNIGTLWDALGSDVDHSDIMRMPRYRHPKQEITIQR